LTLVIAAHGQDFVVLAADSRGTLEEAGGTRVEQNRFRKLRQLNARAALLMYGDADPSNYLIEQFVRDRDISALGITPLGQDFADFCRTEWNKIPLIASERLPGFGYILAGLEVKRRSSGPPRILGLQSDDGFCLRSYDKAGIEGKSVLAHYIFARHFREEMDQDQLSELVAQAIFDTKMVDGDVGGSIHMTIIDGQGMREIEPVDVERMIEQWENPPKTPVASGKKV
jgi:20S proteasome alpha/beta subunit